jgi:hypothetical protein
MDNFYISLETQSWIGSDDNNTTDFCSHGDVVFRINDITFLDGEDDSRTVAATALRLMYSALKDYNADAALEIIPCCGYLLGPGCPTFLTYNTKITENTIEISKIINSFNRANSRTVTEGPLQLVKKITSSRY